MHCSLSILAAPLRLLVVAALTFPLCLNAAETTIVNAKNDSPTLSDDEMRELFLGARTTWGDGTKVVVVLLKDGPGRDALLKFLGKNPSQFNTSWKRMVFTGKGSMPQLFDSEDELVAFVTKSPGAIAFVDAGKVKDGVKAMAIK